MSLVLHGGGDQCKPRKHSPRLLERLKRDSVFLHSAGNMDGIHAYVDVLILDDWNNWQWPYYVCHYIDVKLVVFSRDGQSDLRTGNNHFIIKYNRRRRPGLHFLCSFRRKVWMFFLWLIMLISQIFLKQLNLTNSKILNVINISKRQMKHMFIHYS